MCRACGRQYFSPAASMQVALERKVDAVLADGASLESFEGSAMKQIPVPLWLSRLFARGLSGAQVIFGRQSFPQSSDLRRLAVHDNCGMCLLAAADPSERPLQ